MVPGKSQNRLRKNPRKDWYDELDDVTTDGDLEVTFNLKRPQPSLLAMLASGYTPIYACHVTAAAQRTNPVGTGPFKFVELKQNESIKLTKNAGLLEEGPALSRWHRVHDHSQSLDRDPGLRRREIRHDVPDRGVGPAAQGREVAVAAGDMRSRADERQHQSDRQPRRARRSTTPMCAAPPRLRSTARPSSTSCSRARRTSAARCCRRRAASGACPPTSSRMWPAMATCRRTVRKRAS